MEQKDLTVAVISNVVETVLHCMDEHRKQVIDTLESGDGPKEFMLMTSATINGYHASLATSLSTALEHLKFEHSMK